MFLEISREKSILQIQGILYFGFMYCYFEYRTIYIFFLIQHIKNITKISIGTYLINYKLIYII